MLKTPMHTIISCIELIMQAQFKQDRLNAPLCCMQTIDLVNLHGNHATLPNTMVAISDSITGQIILGLCTGQD